MIRRLFERPLHGFWWLCIWAVFVAVVCEMGLRRAGY